MFGWSRVCLLACLLVCLLACLFVCVLFLFCLLAFFFMFACLLFCLFVFLLVVCVLVGWLAGDWLFGRSVDRLVFGWLVGWSVGWFVVWFVGRFIGWLVVWLAGLLVGWSVGLFVDWLVGMLIVCCLSFYHVFVWVCVVLLCFGLFSCGCVVVHLVSDTFRGFQTAQAMTARDLRLKWTVAGDTHGHVQWHEDRFESYGIACHCMNDCLIINACDAAKQLL